MLTHDDVAIVLHQKRLTNVKSESFLKLLISGLA